MLIGVELDGSSEGDDFVELRSKSISLGCKIEATTSLSQPNHSPFYQLTFKDGSTRISITFRYRAKLKLLVSTTFRLTLFIPSPF